eukprot:SAG31_NODE_26958_length_433_cov_1.392216_1_plen_90_part_10
MTIVPDLLLVTRANAALGLPDVPFMIGDNFLSTMMNQLKHLPFLVLAARVCPASIEGTFFAVLMSVANIGGDVAKFAGAAMTDALGVTNN